MHSSFPEILQYFSALLCACAPSWVMSQLCGGGPKYLATVSFSPPSPCTCTKQISHQSVDASHKGDANLI
jgi:hypothetical protein